MTFYISQNVRITCMAVDYQNIQQNHIIKESRTFVKITKYISRPKISYYQNKVKTRHHQHHLNPTNDLIFVLQEFPF